MMGRLDFTSSCPSEAAMLSISPGDTLLPVPSAIEKAIGYRPHPTTCTRWTRKGLGGVRLATVMVGGRPRTTEAAVLEFIELRSEQAEQGSCSTEGIPSTVDAQ